MLGLRSGGILSRLSADAQRAAAPADAAPVAVATPAEPTIEDLDKIQPDWSILEWDKYIYIPMNTRVAIPNFARGCPFTCTFCVQGTKWYSKINFFSRERLREEIHYIGKKIKEKSSFDDFTLPFTLPLQ